MTDKIATWYVVSVAEDRIETPEDDNCDGSDPAHYVTPEDATDGILNGFHGETGTRYVLEVTVAVVATATRPWVAVKV